MIRKQFIGAVFIIVCLLFCGCSLASPTKSVSKEVGKWHADIKLSDIDTSSMSEEDRALVAMIAGNTLIEIDVEFAEDGTFTYKADTSEVENAISASVGNIFSWVMDIDISGIANNLISVMLADAIKDYNSDIYGKYNVWEDGTIEAVSTNDTLYFQIYGENILIQYDVYGNEVQKFDRN